MIALWMVANCRNGVSSYEVAWATGIAQKSAWFVLQRLRFVMKDTRPAMLCDGPVEADECFIGGKPKNMHQKRRLQRQTGAHGYAEKTPVFGMLERGTRQVRASVIPNVKRETLQKKILDNVGFDATVYSDGWAGYDGLKASGFVHGNLRKCGLKFDSLSGLANVFIAKIKAITDLANQRDLAGDCGN
jgi:transposase-like protein